MRQTISAAKRLISSLITRGGTDESPMSSTALRPALRERNEEVPPRPSTYIDVKQLIAKYDIAEHASRADGYYKSFAVTDAQFRKPFMAFESPELTCKLSAVLSSLDFFPRVRVLDFGCGTGWLSQSLALMGCEVIAVDVSQRALELGRTFTINKYPELAEYISYVRFDGFTFDLPEGSVDRVICFDSFHHVPNQEQILKEFHRVLTPDGRAVFCEPGPLHSSTPASQLEMRMYDVIENDILIDEVWAKAKQVGFQDIKLSVFGIQPTLCTIDEFSTLQSFEKGRGLLERLYIEAIKPVYDGLRLFVLLKDQADRDSHSRDGLRAKIEAEIQDQGSFYQITGTITNTGTVAWRISGQQPGAVNIGLMRRLADGSWEQDFERISFLTSRAPPESSWTFSCTISKERVGDAELYIDLVSEHIMWFSSRSGPPIRLL